jgi:hypothetical protein
MSTFNKSLKKFGKKTLKSTIRSTINLTNNVLSGIKKKRGLILIEFIPESRPRYPENAPHPKLNSLIESQTPSYFKRMDDFLTYKEDFLKIGKNKTEAKEAIRPFFDNYFFSGIDAFALYGIIRKFQPQKFIEIGSGHSTKFAFQAIKDQNLNTEIISIDPYPRTEIDQLCTKIIREPIENTDLSVFQTLKENDIIFIDSSHYTLQNSDVTVIFMEILPYLKPGVIVHIHDIYLPWDYPQEWVERNYSEQYLLAMMLLSKQSDYTILFPNHYLSQNKAFKDVFSANLIKNNGLKSTGTSFWLQVK